MKKRKAAPQRDTDGQPRMTDDRYVGPSIPCALVSVRNLRSCGNVSAAERPRKNWTRRANRRAREAGYQNGRSMLEFLMAKLEILKAQQGVK